MEHPLQLRRCQVLPTCQVHVLHGFVRTRILGSCISFHRSPRRTNSSLGGRATSESFFTTSPFCAAERHQRIVVPHSTRLCLTASNSRPDFVFQTKATGRRARQGVVDTTTVHHQSSRNLTCSCLPVLHIKFPTQLHSGTNACRPLRHRHLLLLLEFLLQMMILPYVSDDSNARI